MPPPTTDVARRQGAGWRGGSTGGGLSTSKSVSPQDSSPQLPAKISSKAIPRGLSLRMVVTLTRKETGSRPYSGAAGCISRRRPSTPPAARHDTFMEAKADSLGMRSTPGRTEPVPQDNLYCGKMEELDLMVKESWGMERWVVVWLCGKVVASRTTSMRRLRVEASGGVDRGRGRRDFYFHPAIFVAQSPRTLPTSSVMGSTASFIEAM